MHRKKAKKDPQGDKSYLLPKNAFLEEPFGASKIE
jgi:hypothetical protein